MDFVSKVLNEKEKGIQLRLPDFGLRNLRVLVRVDYNVPLDSQGFIVNDRRIRLSLDTIRFLVEQNCKVILMSHLGSPKGRVFSKLKMDKVASRLSELLSRPVKKLDDCIGEEVKKTVLDMNPREIIMLENLRFHEEEELNDPFFAKELASLGEVYVNDAFGTCHREHASTIGVTKYLPSFAGFLLKKEVDMLSRILEPEHPFVVLLGGAKVSDKIMLIDNLLEKADKILIGGAMMFTFLKSQGLEVGKSLVEDDRLKTAQDLLRHGKIYLPSDVKCDTGEKDVDKMKPDDTGLDIGEKTINDYKELLSSAKTIFWNGPLGKFEDPKYANGTVEIAKFISTLRATTVVGGGDSAEAIENLGLVDKFTHVSTGGGASLEFIQNGTLPCIEPLRKR